MKKYLLCAILCVIPIMGIAQAQPIKSCSVAQPCIIAWDVNSEPDMKEYRLYLSQTSGLYTTPTMIIPHPTTQSMMGLLAQGTYFVVVTAVDLAGNESVKSNELTFFFDRTPLPPVIRYSVSVP